MTALRLAMWSGPRNLSTAMMRAWGSRDDCAVTDEPLYGFYLARTGLEHPEAAAVMASQSTDWREVTRWLASEPAPDNAQIWYQKHMTHHLLPEVNRDWLGALSHCFLIREPALVAASYAAARAEVTLDDLGAVQQAELFSYLTDLQGKRPLVIAASDLLKHPRAMLERLCSALGIPFTEAMLNWRPGLQPTDGVWARHWYHNVESSTGFAPYRERRPELSPALQAIADRAQAPYRQLYEHRLLAG